MNDKQVEQQHVKYTANIINQESFLLKKQQKNQQDIMKKQSELTADQKIRMGSDEAFYESSMDYRLHEQELLLRHQTLEAQDKRLHTLALMETNPYFARIDFEEDREEETLYIGISSLRDAKDNPIVVDWRTPVANLFYEGKVGSTSYASLDGTHEVEMTLKRQFKIRDGEIQAMADTSDTLTDDLLLDILDEASSDKMKNIVSTIQKSQNEIIRDRHSIIMVQGIAGSGKTSALLQRIAYIIYNNRSWLNPENVFLFSPNHLFTDYISDVLPSLGESGIPTQTFQQFIQQLLPKFTIINENQQEDTFLQGKKNKSNRLKSGLTLSNYMKKYVRNITPFGPMFIDIKTDQQVLIDKAKIRGWYQETNPELPMYQRMTLLQTKLLKKLGGLEKDEAKKSWVKEAVEDVIDDVVANDPSFEDTERNEKKLRRDLAKKFVKKKFKPIHRKIMRYRFVNFGKQYLHFLRFIPAVLLEKQGISQTEWLENILAVQQRLKQGKMLQEDAVLYFMLMKQTYPVYVRQKARYIFIDEMQDFSPAQVWLLKDLYPHSGFNFCGDLNQKVFDNESIVALIEKIFPDKEVKNFELTTSYRSTRQITEFASGILPEKETVKTTAREGDLPVIVSAQLQTALDWLTDKIKITLTQKTHWRTAIICKSLDTCKSLYSQLSDEIKQDVQLIEKEDDFMKKLIMIIPAYLAKGLEFDQVMLWNVTTEEFSSPQDQLILYTMATRAMHQLSVLYTGTPSPFLAQIFKELYIQEEC